MFVVGEIVNTHGIKGEVKVKRLTDFPERFAVGAKVYAQLHNEEKTFTIERSRTHKNLDILHFSGVDSIDEAEKLKGLLLHIKEEQLTPLQKDEYYFHEIIGCAVHTVEGEEMGIITAVLTPGANDVWVMEDEKGNEILIPYIDDVVKKVDIEQKRVTIEVMEGLID